MDNTNSTVQNLLDQIVDIAKTASNTITAIGNKNYRQQEEEDKLTSQNNSTEIPDKI